MRPLYHAPESEAQLAGQGFSFVEILTMCPTGWFLATAQGPDYLSKVLGSMHVLGELKKEGRWVPPAELHARAAKADPPPAA